MKAGSRCLSLLLVAPALAALAGAARAQEPTEEWKRSNDLGNRYEGRIEILVGRPELEAVSFLGHRESYAGKAELKVRFFVPSAGKVRLQAREVEEDVQYFMEAKNQDWRPGQWNEFGPWSTRAVLGPNEVPAGNLAVLARLEDGGTRTRTARPA